MSMPVVYVCVCLVWAWQTRAANWCGRSVNRQRNHALIILGNSLATATRASAATTDWSDRSTVRKFHFLDFGKGSFPKKRPLFRKVLPNSTVNTSCRNSHPYDPNFVHCRYTVYNQITWAGLDGWNWRNMRTSARQMYEGCTAFVGSLWLVVTVAPTCDLWPRKFIV